MLNSTSAACQPCLGKKADASRGANLAGSAFATRGTYGDNQRQTCVGIYVLYGLLGCMFGLFKLRARRVWCTDTLGPRGEHVLTVNRADVLHPDHAPPPGKTDTHFTVRRQYIEACSCCGGGCRVGHGSGAQPKKLAFDFTHRAPRTDIYYAIYYASRSGRGEQPFW